MGRSIKGVREVFCLSTLERGTWRKSSRRILYRSSRGSGSGSGSGSGVDSDSKSNSIDADVDNDKRDAFEGALRWLALLARFSALRALCFFISAAVRFLITSIGSRGILDLCSRDRLWVLPFIES